MNNCTFCYLPLEECNCPSEKTTVRQSGQDYFAALMKNVPPIFSQTIPLDQEKPKKILVEKVVQVTAENYVYAFLPTNPEFKKDDRDIIMELRYLGIPAGKRLKVTIEVLDDDKNG